MTLAVVIPTVDEEQALPLLLADLRGLGPALDEIVIADGSSGDGTVERANASGARVIQVPPPRERARQLNAGARATRAEWLLFLHADSRLGEAALEVIRDAVHGPPRFQAAVFRFAIDLPPPWRRLVETGQALREAMFGLPYGDQGLLVRRAAFDAAGGYPELPLMEDVALVRSLRRRSGVARLRASLLTSGRRYRQRGILRTSLLHTVLITLYSAGVSPARLVRWRDGTNLR